jgi:hypothetical protein
MRGTLPLLLVSIVALVSGALLILWPTDPCAGMQTMFASSCTANTLNLLYVVIGGVVALFGIGGLIVGIRAWPPSPILPIGPIYGSPARVLLLVAVTAILSGLLILFPTDPCAGLRPLIAMSRACTTSGLNLAYTVWGGLAVLIGLAGVIGSIRLEA